MRHEFFDKLYAKAMQRDVDILVDLRTTAGLWPDASVPDRIRRAYMLHDLYLITQRNLLRAVQRTRMRWAGRL